MGIGELSKRTRVSVRMLRYYEERGLLSPQRAANGYRKYTGDDVTRAGRMSSLIRSSLATKLIIPLLQEAAPDQVPGPTDDALPELLAAELARLNSRIACMSLSRDTIRAHLQRPGQLHPAAEVATPPLA